MLKANSGYLILIKVPTVPQCLTVIIKIKKAETFVSAFYLY